jgi:hypothetical protein
VYDFTFLSLDPLPAFQVASNLDSSTPLFRLRTFQPQIEPGTGQTGNTCSKKTAKTAHQVNHETLSTNQYDVRKFASGDQGDRKVPVLTHLNKLKRTGTDQVFLLSRH